MDARIVMRVLGRSPTINGERHMSKHEYPGPRKTLGRIHVADDIFEVSPRTIDRWIREGRLEAVKISNTVRIYADSVIKLQQESAL